MLSPASLPGLAQRFTQHGELATALARHIAEQLGAAIAERGVASIAFSGGSTPKRLFAALAGQRVDWQKVQVTLVDDRCVPPSSERSNAGMLQRVLFGKLDAAPAFFPLYEEGESLQGCNARMAQLALPFDVLILGMGDDAHTASFFPDAENLGDMLAQNDTSLVGETRSAASIERRLTFRLPAVLHSRQVILHICGENKWRVLEEASRALCEAGDTPLDCIAEIDLQYPVLSVLRRSTLHQGSGTPAAIYHASEC